MSQIANHARLLLVASLAACALPPTAGRDDRGDDATDEVASAITDPTDTSPIEPPPSDLAFDFVTPDSIDLSWTCATHATNHSIFRKVDGGTTTRVATLAACQATQTWWFHDPNVEPGRTNCYWVRASNSVSSAESAKSCITIPLDFRVPALPINARVLNIGTDHADLVFTDNSNNEGGFRVFLSEAGGPWMLDDDSFVRATRSDHATGEQLLFKRINLKLDTAYQFKIQVYHDYAPASDELVVPGFQTSPLPPSAATNLHVTGVSDTSVSLAWTSGRNVDHYDVVQTDGISNGTQSIGGSATTYTRTDRLPNVHYCYKVVSVNRGGTAQTPEVCATTSGAGNQVFDVRLALNPSDLFQGTFGPISGGTLNSLELRTAANGPTLDGFDLVPPNAPSSACSDDAKRVHVAKGGSVSGTELAKLYGSETPSLNNPILIGGCPTPRTAQSGFTFTAHFTSPAAAAAPSLPGTVEIATGASLDGAITLRWRDSTGEDAYFIEQVGGSQDVPMAWAPANATSATIYPLRPSTMYCFRVSARNSAGTAVNRDPICATTSNLESQ